MISFSRISKQYGRQVLFVDASFQLNPGEKVGLVGPNGSGKTTLVNAISRVTPCTEGSVRFLGEDMTRASPYLMGQAGMTRTFQGIRLLPTLTVRENVMLGADALVRAQGPRWRRAAGHAKAVAAAADGAIERLGLQPVVHAYPASLSYGTQRRVEIARSLAGAPKLLLLDEPVAGMSRGERDEISAIIRSLREEGLTQLLIEHDLRMIQDVSDHMFVMNFGRLVAEGEPRATAALPVVQEAYLGRKRVLA
jgi:ABC-type branched-subunit amino acid transport system ATPase component